MKNDGILISKETQYTSKESSLNNGLIGNGEIPLPWGRLVQLHAKVFSQKLPKKKVYVKENNPNKLVHKSSAKSA